jgi:zinc D-Ala-D-Ala carboxypeptidase
MAECNKSTPEYQLSNIDRSRPANKSANLDKAEDIPAALRDGRSARVETPATTVAPKKSLPFGAISIGLGLLLAGGAAIVYATMPRGNAPTAANSPPVIPVTTPTTTASADTDNVLNHLPYSEAPDSELVSIGGGYRLRTAAAAKFQAMIADARSSGVNITTISAFRSVEDQKRLFFGIGAERGQQPTKRAEVSAPPKYSEHHTGYAVDVGDSNVPATNLNQSFETTPAYRWLKANAAKYSFELSFPKDNIQKVSYEPWHWRFVGDINSLETFYKARNLNK